MALLLHFRKCLVCKPWAGVIGIRVLTVIDVHKRRGIYRITNECVLAVAGVAHYRPYTEVLSCGSNSGGTVEPQLS